MLQLSNNSMSNRYHNHCESIADFYLIRNRNVRLIINKSYQRKTKKTSIYRQFFKASGEISFFPVIINTTNCSIQLYIPLYFLPYITTITLSLTISPFVCLKAFSTDEYPLSSSIYGSLKQTNACPFIRPVFITRISRL